MIITGTVIIALRKENEIVLGADSKVTHITAANERIALSPKCKIRQVKNIFYASSGLLEMKATDYSVDENAWASIKSTNTIEEAMKQLERLTRLDLREAI